MNSRCIGNNSRPGTGRDITGIGLERTVLENRTDR